jgi:1-acyl-sn-glycerol-3-phosphate acyltransferase
MPADAVVTTLRAIRQLGVSWVRRYHRLEIDGPLPEIDAPVLFVANHGFGGIFDLNVFAAYAVFDELRLTRPVTALTHQLAWTLKLGGLLEPLGSKPASAASAREAVRSGHHVLVMPGGDLDAGKAFTDRNTIRFGGRHGYARLAMDLGLPIVPIVTAGAGESLLVLHDGQPLARALRLDRILRLKALPASVSIPWGLNVGLVGLLPYLGLPTKLHSRVLAPFQAESGETAADFALRVETAMQAALTDLTANRTPVLG